MPASISIVPTSGNVVSTKSACMVTVAGATVNDNTAYSTTIYPQSPAFTYYLRFELASAERGRSYVFTPDSTGGHVFQDYIFPAAGSWTVRLRNAATDASVATASVTVS